MLEPESLRQIKQDIGEAIQDDRPMLDELRSEIRVILPQVRRIQPRTTTSISLVGTDGGNNKIQYDPFLVQLIRVVDSSNNEYTLEPITPNTRLSKLNERHLTSEGEPRSALGRMMVFLGVTSLDQLSHMLSAQDDRFAATSWIQVYRELIEWATLFSMLRDKEFGSDTLIVFDGLLRSKVFAGELFLGLRRGIDEAIEEHRRRHRRKIYVVGFAKHSKVLTRYRLAMALERILTTNYPAYVEIPRDIERKSYLWDEYAREDDDQGEANKFVGGKLVFAKFGSSPLDPIWPIDILVSQVREVQTIMGCLLADALNGFPIPFYPLCLQKAHENAALVDFDFDILQDHILEGIRAILGEESSVLDVSLLQTGDPAQYRY